MESKIFKQENNVVFLEVKINSKKVNEMYIKSAKKLSERINIPGFRKGKTPILILEKHIGEKVILDETIDSLISKTYIDIIDKHFLEPIDKPKINIISIKKNSPLIFNIEIEVVPEGILTGYKGLILEKNIYEINEKHILAELDLLRNKYSKLEIINSEIKNGDIVNIDFEGYIDNKLFKGGSSKNYQLEIGSKTFIPGFEENLIGSKYLEKKDININFPSDYHVDSLKGKKVLFKVEIKEVKRKKIMPLNDEFVKDISEMNSLEELKEKIKNDLNERNKKNIENILKNQALDKCVKLLDVNIPEIMIKEKTDQFLNNIQQDMLQHNMTLKKYYETTGMTEEKFREDYKKNAIKHIKKDILLDFIVKKENILISEKEVNNEIEKISKTYNQSKENLKIYFKDNNNIKMLKKGLSREKAIKFILDNAKIKEIKTKINKNENNSNKK